METKQCVVFFKGKSDYEDSLDTEIETYKNGCTHISLQFLAI
jgi:hypothetical protein